MSDGPRPSFLRRLLNSWRAWRRGTYGTIDLVPEGFAYAHNRRSPVTILWRDITCIEAGVLDAITIDKFYVVIHTASHDVVIDEFEDGFRLLENGIFEHWPQVKEQWTSLYNGPPSQPRRETLWRRAG